MKEWFLKLTYLEEYWFYFLLNATHVSIDKSLLKFIELIYFKSFWVESMFFCVLPIFIKLSNMLKPYRFETALLNKHPLVD